MTSYSFNKYEHLTRCYLAKRCYLNIENKNLQQITYKLLKKALASHNESINDIKRPLKAYYCLHTGEKFTFRLGLKMQMMIAPNNADQGWPDFCVIFITSLCAFETKQTE